MSFMSAAQGPPARGRGCKCESDRFLTNFPKTSFRTLSSALPIRSSEPRSASDARQGQAGLGTSFKGAGLPFPCGGLAGLCGARLRATRMEEDGVSSCVAPRHLEKPTGT